MNAGRLWAIAGSVVIVAILVLGWFVGISPVLDTAAASQDSLATVEQSNSSYEAQLDVLAGEFAKIDDVRAQLATATEEVPGDAAIAELLRELDALQGSTGVPITSITFADASVYIPPAAAPAVVETAPAPDAGSTPAPTDSSTPAPAASDPTAGLAPLDAADAALLSTGNFVVIPVDLAVGGDQNAGLAFVTGLQSMKRLFLVTKFELGAETGSTIHGLIYVLIDPTATQQPAAQ
jgi:hypothetical protein